MLREVSPKLLFALSVALAGVAPAQEFRSKAAREASEHFTVPQESATGITVRWRLGKDGPVVEKRNLNGQFDRIAETRKLLDREGYPLERRAAVKELARYKDDRVTYALILALRDINPTVREDAAIALGNIGDVRAVKPLIDMLGYSNPTRAMVVARSLEKITGVYGLGASLEAWETWWEAYRKWPHGVGTPVK